MTVTGSRLEKPVQPVRPTKPLLVAVLVGLEAHSEHTQCVAVPSCNLQWHCKRLGVGLCRVKVSLGVSHMYGTCNELPDLANSVHCTRLLQQSGRTGGARHGMHYTPGIMQVCVPSSWLLSQA